MLETTLPSEILSEKDVKLIIEAINSSKDEYEYWRNEQGLGFENGKYLYRWNFIFSKLKSNFKDKPFKTYNIPRGKLWEFLVLYNTDTKILYLILKENTFNIIRNRKDNPYHYLRVLNSKNFHLQDEIKQQMSLFPEFETISNEYIEEDLDRMISAIKEEVKGCVNILFKEDHNGVYSISANLANYELDIFKSYDLSKYITVDIHDIIDTKDNIATETVSIPLNIRESKIKNNNKEIVGDKTKKDNKKQDKN